MKGTDTKVYYRGQERDYALIPSLYRRAKTREDAKDAGEKLAEIMKLLWFAHDRTYVEETREQRFDEDVGYIYVIAVPCDETKVKVIDLREKLNFYDHIHNKHLLSKLQILAKS